MKEGKPQHSEGEKQEHEPIPKQLFEPGQIVVTQGAIHSLTLIDRHPIQLVARHLVGDWGQLCEEDVQENERSLENDYRLFSAYNIEDAKFYVITEWDRSITTVLTPSEY